MRINLRVLHEMARRAEVHSLILAHFRELMDRSAHHDQAVNNVSEAFKKTVTIAEDFQQFEINGNR